LRGRPATYLHTNCSLPGLQQLVQDLECTYRTVYSNILHMTCVRARLVKRLKQVVKTGTVECSGDQCDPKQLIVGVFVNIRLHHSLKEATPHLSRNKVRRNRKQLKFSHCQLVCCKETQFRLLLQMYSDSSFTCRDVVNVNW